MECSRSCKTEGICFRFINFINTDNSTSAIQVLSDGQIKIGNNSGSSTVTLGYSGKSTSIKGDLSVDGTAYSNGNLVVYGSFNVLSNPSYLNTTTNVNASLYYAGHPTTSSSANAFINSSTGLVARSTSSLRYKIEIQEQDIPINSILSLNSKSFIDKAQYEENGQKSDGLQRILGLIAEEVAEIPVLGNLLVNRNEQGQPDSINYDRVAVALIPIIKELYNLLKNKIKNQK